jgi:hypothetical protein
MDTGGPSGRIAVRNSESGLQDDQSKRDDHPFLRWTLDPVPERHSIKTFSPLQCIGLPARCSSTEIGKALSGNEGRGATF